MANRIQQSAPVTDSFHQFSILHDEIRLMIWEYTWPDSRVMEVGSFNNPEAREEGSEEPSAIANLRLAGSLFTFLEQGLLRWRGIYNVPMEQCFDPVALRVCYQSRMHTLQRYRLMPSLARPFYYNPQRDMLFLSDNVVDNYATHMTFLQRHHRTELNYLETILVLDGSWPKTVAEKRLDMGYALEYISHLGGLHTIQTFIECEESVLGLGLDDKGMETGLLALAERLRSNFPAVIETKKCTAKKIEVIDSDGKLY